MKMLLVLLVLMGGYCVAQTSGCFPVECSSYGPAILDTSAYSTVYVVREHTNVGESFWLGLYLNNQFYVKLNDDEKYIIKVYKSGKYEIWTKTFQRSAVKLSLERGKQYFIEFRLNPGAKYPKLNTDVSPKLTLVDEQNGVEWFNQSKAKLINVNYPVRAIQDVTLSKSETSIIYSTVQKDIDFGLLNLKYPSWSFFAEYVPFYGIVNYGYFDPLVSNTYSEAASVYKVSGKRFRDSLQFSSYAENELNKLIEADSKRGNLVSKEPHRSINTGKYSLGKCFITQDRQAPNKGRNNHLTVYSIVVFMYLEKGKEFSTYRISYTQRGVDKELWSHDVFKHRANDFVKGISKRK